MIQQIYHVMISRAKLVAKFKIMKFFRVLHWQRWISLRREDSFRRQFHSLKEKFEKYKLNMIKLL